jgi:hypothetical protein
MTEDDWITATDPQSMLLFLRNSGKASERKLRLFAVACCRRIWHLLSDERSRQAAEVAGRLADGLASEVERLTALEAAAPAAEFEEDSPADYLPGASALNAIVEAHRSVKAEATAYCASLAFAVEEGVHPRGSPGLLVERIAQAALLRDIFGPLPFRPVTLHPSIRTWNDGIIPKIAEAAYQERALPSGELDRERLAVLADALEEVGADDLLLGHLRGPGPHVRGDWLIDILTGRE